MRDNAAINLPCGTDRLTTAGLTLAAAFAMVSLVKQREQCSDSEEAGLFASDAALGALLEKCNG